MPLPDNRENERVYFYPKGLLMKYLPQGKNALGFLFECFFFGFDFNTACLSIGRQGVFPKPFLFHEDREARDRARFTPHQRNNGEGNNHLHGTQGGITRYLGLRNQNGQNLIEYAIVIALVSVAIVAMSTYVYRSVQATQKVVEEEFRSQ